MAGMVTARCTCCPEPQTLAPAPELDATRRFCPRSLRTYLDRGDGLFEADGGALPAEGAGTGGENASTAPEVLSDRPQRTGPKTRIALERATFA
jgi:hypothetical protein